MEEFRILTLAQFDRAVDECLSKMTELSKSYGPNPLIDMTIELVQTFCMDLEHTLFKED